MSLSKFSFFPTSVYVCEKIPSLSLEDQCNIRSYCIKVYDASDYNHAISNPSGWQSIKNVQESTELTFLTTSILREVVNIVPGDHLHRFTPFVDAMWVNVNPEKSFNFNHVHAGCWMSGTYYVTVPQNSGHIVFTDPRPGADVCEWHHMINSQSNYKIMPKEGSIIFFPGWLPHYVEVNNNPSHRISISFNIKLRENDTKRSSNN